VRKEEKKSGKDEVETLGMQRFVEEAG